MAFDWVLKQQEAISVPSTHTHNDKPERERGIKQETEHS